MKVQIRKILCQLYCAQLRVAIPKSAINSAQGAYHFAVLRCEKAGSGIGGQDESEYPKRRIKFGAGGLRNDFLKMKL